MKVCEMVKTECSLFVVVVRRAENAATKHYPRRLHELYIEDGRFHVVFGIDSSNNQYVYSDTCIRLKDDGTWQEFLFQDTVTSYLTQTY